MSDPSTATKTFTRDELESGVCALLTDMTSDWDLDSERADQRRDPPDGGPGIQFDRRRPARRRRSKRSCSVATCTSRTCSWSMGATSWNCRSSRSSTSWRSNWQSDGRRPAGRSCRDRHRREQRHRPRHLRLARPRRRRFRCWWAVTRAAWRRPRLRWSKPAPPRRWCCRSTCAPRATWRAWPPRRWNGTVASTSLFTRPASCAPPGRPCARSRSSPATSGTRSSTRTCAAPILANRAVLPAMLRAGRGDILNVSSKSGRQGIAFDAPYCASKFGVIGFSEALAEEVAGAGVRVQVLAPGRFATEVLRQTGPLPTPDGIPPGSRVADVILWMLTMPADVRLASPILESVDANGAAGAMAARAPAARRCRQHGCSLVPTRVHP